MDNKYKYIKRISSGAFSVCDLYKNNSKLFAIKTAIDLEDGISYNELREIFSLLILTYHPNIIRLNEIFINIDGILNIVYKYYPKTLSSYIIQTNTVDRLPFILPFIKQMISALYYMHSNGIIHTDLKEANIMLSSINNFDIKIIDFGSCHIKYITEKYSIVSTYTIRAPEVYTYDYNYDNKIDIWSFGVVLYRFITGNYILDHNKHHNTSDIEKLKEIYNFIDNIDNLPIEPKFKTLLKKMLEIDPEKRLDIYSLITLFQELFNINIPLSIITNKLNNIKLETLDNKLEDLNNHISLQLFNVKLKKLNFGNLILKKLKRLNSLDYATIWYLNYQFTHADVEYNLKDFLPIFNAYYKTVFDIKDIHNNCFIILDVIEFDLF
jgi:serine/threonine protein kinase